MAKKMSKKTITLLVLVGIVIVLGSLFAVVSMKPEEEPQEDVIDETVVLQDFEAETIERLVLKSPEGEKVAFVREEVETTVKNAEGENETTSEMQWMVENDSFEYKLEQSKIDSLSYSFSFMKAERMIEETAPSDLKPYGLDEPFVATAERNDGSKITAYCGNKTPTGSTYYVMIDGDDAIYEMYSNYGNNFRSTLNEFRNKQLFADIDYSTMQQVMINRADQDEIEITKKPEIDEELAQYSMGIYQVTKPFIRKPDLNGGETETMMTSLPTGIEGVDIIEDSPTDLSKYGLADPYIEYYVLDQQQGIRILVGDLVADNDELRYAMMANGETVYTINRSDISYLETVKPFDVADHFVLLINIESVDSMEINGLGQSHTMSIQREQTEKDEDEDGELDVVESYFINHNPVAEDLFKDTYQLAIGMVADGLAEKETNIDDAEITIVYHLNLDKVKEDKVAFVPYNDNFYAVYYNDVAEFVIAKKEVENLFNELNKIS